MEFDAAQEGADHRAPVLVLLWVLGSWVALFMTQALLYSPGSSSPVFSFVITSVHVLITCLIVFSGLDLRTASLVIGGFVFRLGAMVVDLYAPFKLPITATPDDIRFQAAGEAIAANLSLAGETYGGTYSSFLGYMFALIGPDRLAPQYLNVLFGTSALLVLVLILRMLSAPPQLSLALLALGAFLPAPALFSAQLIREALLQFLVAASMACFLAGVFRRRWSWLCLATVLVLLASALHAGVLAVLLGYAVILALFSSVNGRLRFNLRGLLPTAVGVVVLGFVLWRLPDLFLGKFSLIESESDLLASANRRDGGAAYLTGLQVTDPLGLALLAPLRAIYFLLSPLPWDWRGPGDALAFVTDSSFYLVTCATVLQRRKLGGRQKGLLLVFVVVLTLASLIFGLGVSNSGTAIRHRGKLAILFIGMLAVALSRESRSGAEARVRGRRVPRERGMLSSLQLNDLSAERKVDGRTEAVPRRR